MKTRHVKQAISEDCLFNILAAWCRTGGGHKSDALKIVTAFASGTGVSAISPLLDVFLSKGNRVDIIFGVDRNGTDRSAVAQLYALTRAHTGQLHVRVFHAPGPNSIFHPKLYIYDCGQQIDFVIGSANLTSGGLASNFESLLLYEDVPRKSFLAREVLSIWKTFANPQAPLSKQFLTDLTRRNVNRLFTLLPARTALDTRNREHKVRALWRPLSRIQLPHSGRVEFRRRYRTSSASHYLLMDLLNETRKTQVQIPLPVVEGFFQTKRDRPKDIMVSVLTDMGLTQSIRRPLVISGLGYGRLMRRLEMPQIKSMDRPLAVVFLKLHGKARYAYSLIEQRSVRYRAADKILRQHGQQMGFERRYIIGTSRDVLWPQISRILRSNLRS